MTKVMDAVSVGIDVSAGTLVVALERDPAGPPTAGIPQHGRRAPGIVSMAEQVGNGGASLH